MKKMCSIAVVLIFLSGFSWADIVSYEKDESKIVEVTQLITKDMLQHYLENILAFGPRVTGTEACREAGKYIHDAFLRMGLETTYQNWTASVDFKTYEGENIEGVVQGDEKIIVFNAHFDSVGTTVGADDNAAGIAALLAAAEVVSAFTFEHTIKFVAVSGEEQGLLGSHAYARAAYERGDEIVVELNADMIGHAESEEGERTFRIYATEDADWIVTRIGAINEEIGTHFTFVTGNISRKSGGSDYLSFARYGYEAMAFFEYEWNPHMHQPEDTISNVNLDYLLNTTRLIAGTIAFLGDAEMEKPYLMLSSPKRGRIYVNGEEIYQLIRERTAVIGKNVISAHANSPHGIEKVEFYVDDRLVYTDDEAPYEYEMSRISFRKHDITVVAYDAQGKSALDSMDIFWLDFGL